mmetsp:Transcript_558/g.1098  ORF Transcript_558/g.1098 Transcript_558/m.1098 type:complete len:133 (-) Transcript_558:1760-2158(-)
MSCPSNGRDSESSEVKDYHATKETSDQNLRRSNVTDSNGIPANSENSSMKAPKRRKHAIEADPIEYPWYNEIWMVSKKIYITKHEGADGKQPTLVIALVTFPAASKRSVVSLTFSGCMLISEIPPALSAIGP